VRAIVIAAREALTLARCTTDDGVDAAAATRRLLDRLTDYDHTVLSTRGWALHPQTIRVTASQLGVAPVNVQRNQPRADRRFRELLADPAHAAVVDVAEDLRRRLGPLTRKHTAEQELKDLGLDLATDAGEMLLHLAGPYSCKDTWLEDTAAMDWLPPSPRSTRRHPGRRPDDRRPHPETRQPRHPPHTAIDFIESRPACADSPTDGCAGDPPSPNGPKPPCTYPAHRPRPHSSPPPSATAVTRSPCARSSTKTPRFTRATNRPGHCASGASTSTPVSSPEIAARIDAAGGAISTKALVDGMTAAIPDVAESSVRSYLSAPGFVIENGRVRRRTEADGWPAVPPLNTCPRRIPQRPQTRYASRYQ